MTKATGATFRVDFRRRREGVTDYADRLALLKAGNPRLVVRKTNKYVVVQLIEYSPDGDKAIAGASSRELRKYGFAGKCNTPSAYLTGALVGKKGIAKGVKAAVADFGRHSSSKGGLLFAALKGAADAGIEIAFDESMLPSADRLEGKHLNAAGFVDAKKKIMGA